MKTLERLKIAAGAVLMAAVMWVFFALPGILSDRDSTVPVGVEAGNR